MTIRDEGQWRPPRGAHRGRGVMMMRGLMDFVDIEHTDEGTTVVLERTLGAQSA
jgi:anti-sigma regulatory factor (Ser/Thr protein kinase)